MFKFLKANDIGQTHALFYEVYGTFLEMRKAYALANEVFTRGVEMNAEPLSRLKMQFEQFQKRVRKREQKKQELGQVLEDSSQSFRQFGDTVTKTGRRIEAGLSSLRQQQRGLGGNSSRSIGGAQQGTVQGDRRSAGGIAISANQSNIKKNSNNFQVFEDNNNNNNNGNAILGGGGAGAAEKQQQTTNWKNLGTRDETIKENAAKPSKWNEVSLTASKRKLAPGTVIDPTIEVYEDTECLDAELVQKALKKPTMTTNASSLRDRMDLQKDVKVNPVSAHERAKLVSQSQMKQATSVKREDDDGGNVKKVNLKETFEEQAVREWRENHSDEQQRMPHQSAIIVPSSSNDTNNTYNNNAMRMDVDEEAASKRNEKWLPGTNTTKKGSEQISQIDSCENEKSAQNSVAAAINPPPQNKPSAGARWTKDEGGFLQPNVEPTMTFTTKEAWGDVMAMFSSRSLEVTTKQDKVNSDDAVNDNSTLTKTSSSSGSGYDGDGSRGARTPILKSSNDAKASNALPSAKVVAKKKTEEFYADDFLVREDTVVLNEVLVNDNNNDFGFDIREDTECIPNINEIKNSHVFQSKGFGSPIAVLKERSVSDTDGNNDAEAPRPARQKSSLNNNTVISTNINNNNTLNENRPSTTNNERTVLTAVPAVNDNEIQLIDPFANIDSLLSAISIESCVNVSLSSDPNELSVLLAAGKRVSGARGAVGKKPGEGIEVSLGNKTYVLRSKAGEGAYAQVYEAEGEELEIEDDENAAAARRSSLETLPVYAIKVESKKLASWEYTISKRLCERLPRGAPRDVVVPSHLRLLFDGNTSTHTTGALVMKFGDHGTLQDVINFYKLTDSKNGTMDERLAMYYSIELLRLLEWTHECDVLHCDVKPDNLLIRNGGERWMDWDSIRTGSWKKKGLALIDFGRAIDLRDYPNTTYFIGDAGTEAFSCPEMRKKNEPWLFQADLFAIAATIHVLLHGEYMDTIEDKNTGKYVPKLAFKRYWNQDVWKLVFGKLMNHPLTSKEEKPNLREIREVLEKALTESSSGGSILKQLLVKQTIGMFELIKEGKAI